MTNSISTRYLRALSLTGPKTTVGSPGAAVDGYWIENGLYYFLAESLDPVLNRVVKTPSVFDCRTNRIKEVILPGELSSVLSRHCGKSVEVERLSSAQIELIDSDRLAVCVDHVDYIVDVRERRVTEARASLAKPALYSPDGRNAVVINGNDLWLRDRVSGGERPLTIDGATHCAYGQTSETGGGAISYRKSPKPMGLWSPDSQWFLTHRIDERSLPEFALVENVPSGTGRPLLHRYKYALPGDPQPVATYVAIHVATGRVVSFDQFPVTITSFSPFYLRRAWFDGEDRAWFVRLDRHWKRADLVSLDLESGEGRLVLSETADAGYLDINPFIIATPNIRTLAQSDEVMWFSDRDGWGQLYLYEASTGRLKNRITCGDWLVKDIVHVDQRERKVLMLVGGAEPNVDPARRTLCSVNLDGSGFEILLQHDGDVYVPITEPSGTDQSHPFSAARSLGVSPDGRYVVARYGNVERGNQIRVVDLRRRDGVTISSSCPSMHDVSARRFQATAADGKTPLYGVLFFPTDFDQRQQYPLIDYIYPGPQIAHAPQSFRTVNACVAESLAELGFITMMLDSRSTPTRNRAFNQGGYGTLLEPQLSDHAAVIRQLCGQHAFVKADRIGIIGHSGGGTATARALFDYPDVFGVGVSVCGNHDSNLYAATWSDKFRGPAVGARWKEPSNDALAYKLRGRLLLISGDMDENVHVSQTMLLVSALMDANRDFDLLIVPKSGHGVLMTSGYAQRRVWDYLVKHLRGEEPPADFEVKFKKDEIDLFLTRYWKEVMQ